MHFRKYILTLLFINGIAVSFAQDHATGYFTSEAAAVTLNEDIIVSIKKYNPTQTEIDNATKPSPNTPMNYLMAPFTATNISLFGKAFESTLYCLGKDGRVKWNKNLGFSDKSLPSPVRQYNGFLYAGEAAKDKDQVIIRKIDNTGKTVWEARLDSLHNVNGIYAEDDKVCLLVSFDVSKRQEEGGTYSEKVYPIYFFVQLSITSGKKLSQEYQQMGNYLSGIGFGNPCINTNFSYFLSNKDSAVFLDVSRQGGAMVVSEHMSKENTIREFAAGTESYHLLTLLSARGRQSYNLISDFYGLKKKYESAIPAVFDEMNREFVCKNRGDSLLTVISSVTGNSIYYTDPEGKTALYKKTDDAGLTTVAAGEITNRPFLIQVEGRNKPGTTGKLRIGIY